MPRLRPILALLVLAACAKNEPAPPAPSSATPAPTAAATSEAHAAATAALATAAPRDGNARIFHPDKATEKAPEKYKAKFATTKGDFVIEVTRAFAPNGADRFYNLVKLGYYDGERFFRVVDGFMVQFGISGDPAVNGAWYNAFIPDDPVVEEQHPRLRHVRDGGEGDADDADFINFVDKNARLDKTGFAPFGQVVEGMKVVDSLYKGYGEMAPNGKGPDPSRASREGEAYLAKEFPELDKIKSATIL